MALKLYDKLTPSGDFALVGAADVEMPDGTRLSQVNLNGGGTVDETSIIKKITDPDNYPLSKDTQESTSTTISLEVGKLSRDNGSERDNEGGLRTPDFVPVEAGSVIYFHYDIDTLTRLCLLFYDSNHNFIYGWNDGTNYMYPISDVSVTCPSNASYLKGYFSVDLTEGTLTISNNVEEVSTKAEFKKIYIADHGYSVYGDNIDDATMHKIVIKAEGKDGNSYNITEIKAPSDNPQEATIALMNWGNGAKQFVDFSSMVYDPDDPTVEIVCQTRNNKPLPEFSVRFNDGNGAGRVKKLVVTPDCIPIKLTSEGIQVRRNNNYNNDATEDELVTVNLADLYDKVNAISELSVSYPIQDGGVDLQPERYYTFGEVDSLSVNLVEVDDGKVHEHCFEFIPTEDFDGLTITPEPKWANEPQYPAGKTCQVSILRGIGVMVCA